MLLERPQQKPEKASTSQQHEGALPALPALPQVRTELRAPPGGQPGSAGEEVCCRGHCGGRESGRLRESDFGNIMYCTVRLQTNALHCRARQEGGFPGLSLPPVTGTALCPTDSPLLHSELKLVPTPRGPRRTLWERRSSTCAVFQLMAVGSTPLPARGLQRTCQLLLTPGGAGRPCFEVEPAWSYCQQESVQICWAVEGSLQALPPGQREGRRGRSEGALVQAGSGQN